MRVVVGRIGRPHGVRGEVTVEVRTDEPERRFVENAPLLLARDVDGPSKPYTVTRVHWHSGRLLLSFAGVNDRNDAEGLRGNLLIVERDENETPDDPDEFYDSALLGCSVELADGSLVGTVKEVVHLPSQDCLVIAREGASEILIPFLTAMVPEVDIQGRRIVIAPADGLLESQEGESTPETSDEPS
jgi:16S rRNA processing protein RimM